MSDTYKCPVCGEYGRDAYLRCYHPGCLDGRTPSTMRYPSEPLPPIGFVRFILFPLFCGVILALAIAMGLSWGLR